jgi:Tol biopolymer transport system component
MVKIVISLILLLAISSSSISENPEGFEWGNLKNLGPNINSPGKDEHVTFTGDGKTMYFASIREGGMGAYDLYISKFENGEWCKAICLPAPINTKRDEFDPFVTLDGSKLFFASNRHNHDKYWNCDIFVSEWDGEKWGKPRIYDSTFVTPGKPDWGVAVPKDFKTFIFSSGREPAKPHSVQIFQSIWLGDKWSVPSPFPAPVNSGGWEATPYITPDGKTLFLNSGRGEENKKDVDIWKFENVNGRWTNPQLMKGPFLSDKHDYDPCLSPDGKKFYFTSNREGGLGGSDIYVVEKIDYQKEVPGKK